MLRPPLRQGIATPDLVNRLFELGRGAEALTTYALALASDPDHIESATSAA